MIHDYDGTDVIGSDGQKIGTVVRTFVDDRGNAQFVEIKHGLLGRTRRMVPLGGASETEDGLQVPYSQQFVNDSPDVSDAEDTLGSDQLAGIRDYYSPSSTGGALAGETGGARPVSGSVDAADSSATADGANVTDSGTPTTFGRIDGTSANSAQTAGTPGAGSGVAQGLKQAVESVGGVLHGNDTSGQDDPVASDTGAAEADGGADNTGGPITTQVIDKGDYLEIPIVEERLVKQPVVTEVVRVHKTSQTQQQTVAGDVRTEDVEVVQEGDAQVHDNRESE